MSFRRNIFPILTLSLLVFLVACDDYYDELENDFDDGDEDVVPRSSIVGTYQAENHTKQSGCRTRSNHSGYTGSGFMDYGDNNSMVEWDNVNVPSAGEHTLTATASDDLRARKDLGDLTRTVRDDHELLVGTLQGGPVNIPLLDNPFHDRVPEGEQLRVARRKILKRRCDNVWGNRHIFTSVS